MRRIHALVLLTLMVGTALAQSGPELTYQEYRDIARTAIQLKHCAMFEPLDGEAGMNLVVGDRFGKLNVFRLLAGDQRELVWTSRQLVSTVMEVLVCDMDQDGLDDHILCRTQAHFYVFALEGFFLTFESPNGKYEEIRAFTVGNVDADSQLEIILLADRKIQYIDGLNHSDERTSLRSDIEGTVVRCGDVTGDGNNEVILDTGQIFSRALEVVWSDQTFGPRLELLDIDGDGIMEVLTESDASPLRVWDVDFEQEKRF